MRKFAAVLLAAALLLCGCGGEKQEAAEQTTVSGMVVSVDGTKVELISTEGMTMGGGNRPNRGESDGNYTRPQGGNRPEGDFTMPEGFEGFNGQMPEGFEGGKMPNFGGQRPEGAEGDFTWPEGDFTMPEGFKGFGEGEMPTMPEGGFNGGNRFNTEDMETTTVDLKDAHISVEIDGGKASGSLNDIEMGTFVTITMNGKGEVTNVLVSAQSSFGGGRRPTN